MASTASFLSAAAGVLPAASSQEVELRRLMRRANVNVGRRVAQ